jgi:hypothetical protein
MKIQTCLFPLLLGLAIAPGARAQNDNTLIDVNATALGLLDGAVVDTLTNSGAAGDFTTLIGQVELISHPANANAGALVQGLAFNGDKMVSTNPQSSTTMEGNRPYTAMAWVYNPGFGAEEAIVSWGHRGGPDGSNSGMHQGNNATFGAVGHWGSPDTGWGPSGVGTDINATANRWAHLAYTWDGTTESVYIDGELSNSEIHIPLSPHLSFQDGTPTPFAIGSESDAGNVNSTPIAYSGTIAKVLVEDVARSEAEIRTAFNAESSLFFDGVLDVSDLDGDGIFDSIEDLYDCLDKNVADADADPDGDSLSNRAELGFGTNPCNPDSDGDGLSDGEELNRLVGGQSAPTDPLSEDTDGDGLLDSAETGTGVVNGTDNTGTDPLVSDTDADGLGDLQEVQLGTDPFNVDTDGDGAEDGAEVALQTDPLDASSKPAFPSDQIVKVDMTCLDLADGSIVDTVVNLGQAGPFTTLIGQVEVASHPANDNPDVQVQGLAFNGDKMTAAVDAPTLGLVGNQTYTVRAWVFNPAFGNEEAVVSWGHRGGPLGSNAGMHQGSHPTFGAIGHWGGGPVDNPNEPDVGWGPNGDGSDILATQGRWAQLSWVYDGLEDRVFIDGEFNNSEEHPNLLNVHASYNDGNPTLVCLGSESDAGSVNNTPIAYSGTIARVEIYDSVWTDEEVQAAFEQERPLFFDGICTSPGDPYQFVVSSPDGGGTIDFEWNSSASEVYTVVASDNPAGNPDPASWAPVAGLESLSGTPPLNTHSIARPAGDLRLFKLIAGPAPALFSDDFEAGAGEWTSVVNDEAGNTQWELGSPSGTSGPLTGADESGNAWSTNLGDYGQDSDVSLFSPPIDFGGLQGAELTFDAYRDADGFGDSATVVFRRVGDDVQLGMEIAIDMGLFDTAYESLSIAVPEAVIGETARVEFNFVSDGTADAFSGLTIDNVVIEASAP